MAYVIGRAHEVDLELQDVHVFEVLEVEQDYLRAIGAVGGEGTEPSATRTRPTPMPPTPM